MKNNLKIAIIIAIIIFVPLGSVALLFLVKRKKDEKIGPTEPSSNKTTEADIYPLRQGSKGALVSALQTKLNVLLNQASLVKAKLPTLNGVAITSLVVDNNFGPKTLAVVRWHFGTDTVTQTQYKTL